MEVSATQKGGSIPELFASNGGVHPSPSRGARMNTIFWDQKGAYRDLRELHRPSIVEIKFQVTRHGINMAPTQHDNPT